MPKSSLNLQKGSVSWRCHQMSFNKCQDLVDTYVERINQKLSVKDIDGVCEITTPFRLYGNSSYKHLAR